MTPTKTAQQQSSIADVQNSADTRQIAIDKVGIKDIRHPVRVQDRSGGEQHTIATFNMYVNLPHNFKGTHMSRFVEILNQHEREITIESFKEMLSEMTDRLEADSGHIEMNFSYFINKAAPVSGVESLLDYDVTLIGEIIAGKPKMNVKVVVPVTSLCPCSKKISDYGAHNQRSHVTVNAETNGFVWFEDLIDIVENEASCELFGLLKRPAVTAMCVGTSRSATWCSSTNRRSAKPRAPIPRAMSGRSAPSATCSPHPWVRPTACTSPTGAARRSCSVTGRIPSPWR